ncbi:MAG TPA: type II toxin-antitoxin system RelE/ParE family toxin [Caulobacteraceae bacterium]|jgi:toxin ParE1/3/4|nr:type II toxin-antitoxin system RelE/ParE family toxin [Caulobacteraceae bacterium]
MTYKVVFDQAAEDDLVELAGWIAEMAGHRVAARYLARLTDFCLRLDVFPKRGAARDDLLPGLRTIGFEGRALIAFRVTDDTVSVLRVLYGGRDSETILADLR